MRILIFAIGSAGDVHPFVGLGRALQRRGHEVVIACNGHFEETVTAAGHEFRAHGSAADFARVVKNPDIWHPLRAFPAIVKSAAEPGYPLILELCREAASEAKSRGIELRVVASSLAWAAISVCEKLNLPVVSVHLAPSLFASAHEQPVVSPMMLPDRAPYFLKRLQWWIGGRVVDATILPGLNRFRAELSLPPLRNMLQAWHAATRSIGMFPPWFGAPQPDWPRQARLTGFPMYDESDTSVVNPAALEEFLAAGTAPVVFTPGSAMDRGNRFFQTATDALEISGHRGIFLTRFPDSLPRNLPAGIATFPYVPFSRLLPRVALLVHHGGIGTCAQALAAGVPQLIHPLAHDQFDTLHRVRRLGVGDGLVPRKFSPTRAAAMISSLTNSPEVAAAAAEVAGKFDVAGWLEQTCKLIETAPAR